MFASSQSTIHSTVRVAIIATGGITMKSLKEIRDNYNDSLPDKADGITQQMIAEELKTSKDIISKLESGRRKPTPEELFYYSRKFKVSVEYILDDTLKAKQPKNATISRDLGITDMVISTMKSVNNISNTTQTDEYNKILHAFIGNGQTTITFLQQMLNYLNRQYQFEHFILDNSDDPNEAIKKVATNTATIDALMISNIMAYINNVIKPQLNDVLEQNYQEALMIHELPDEIKYS